MGKLGITFLALSGFFLGIHADGSQPVLSMCVPEIYWKECVDMMKDSAAKGIPISCIAGRDRYECVEKVGRKEADIVAVDPEDMYLAAKNNFANDPGYNVVEQIRTKEEPDEPNRYEAVAVIHKDLEIFDVQSFRGLNSCHTGVGRNVGYKIPITKLTAMGVLANINDPEYSARENEIRALSTLFNKGCLVGTWSPDPEINKKLKEKYSNMCALCEDPVKCDYPDKFSGYDGALRCLAHNGGQVAFTKVIYVKRFFGLPVGKTAAVPTDENPSDFAYFCPDGTKVPIDKDTKPCTWAARPWQSYMTNGQVHDIPAVQKEIEQLGALGEKEKAAWWKDLLLLDEKTIPVSIKKVQPEEYLEQSKYLDVIERNSGAPERDARWCVWDDESLAKCHALAKAAHSRDARPRLDCVREKDQEACLTTLRDEGADLVVLTGGSVKKAIEQFNVRPIIAENYTIGSTKFSERPAVAVIKKDSPINTLAGLKDKKSCHTFYKNDFAGWLAPVQALKKSNLITSEEEIVGFFSGSCAPGASKASPLCQQCVGDSASQDDQTKEATRCQASQAEAFSGGKGAIRCLTSGKGDVAFVPYTTLQLIKNDTNSDIKTSDLMLLCPNGGVAAVENYENCNFGYEPPRIIVTHAGKTDNVIDELTHGVLTATTLYSKRPDLLQLFGSWGGHRNVLFKDDAIGLVSVNNTWDRWDQWAATEQDFGAV